MRRYFITLIIAVLAVGGVGSYFVYRSLDQLPHYKIVTAHGDARELDSIVLSGQYRTGIYSQQIEITASGSRLQSERTFYDNYLRPQNWFFNDWEVAPLIDNYRGFMRGKMTKSSFYNDGEWLIYAQPEITRSSGLLRVEIDALHLTTGERRTFQSQLDTEVYARNRYLADIQLIDHELHLLIGLLDKSYEYKDYIVNVEDGTFQRAVSVTPPEIAIEDGSGRRSFSYVSRDSDMAPADTAVLSLTDYSFDRGGMMLIKEQFLVYRYSTGELLTIMEEASGDTAYRMINSHQWGSTITILKLAEEQLMLTNHRIMAAQAESQTYTYTAEELSGQQIISSMLWGDRAYVLTEEARIPSLTIIDLNNGGIVYNGSVSFDGPESGRQTRMEQLQMYNLTLNLQGR